MDENQRYQLVIVDTEDQFFSHLEEEVIRRYADQLTVQIITRAEYAEEFFAEPQTIDVLVTDKLFYHEDLKNHQIGHILLLADEVEMGDEFPEDVQVLMKYVPAEEVFQRIDEALQDVDVLEREETEEQGHNTRVITVYSPIGGCGKSLVAYALAKKLKKLDQKVLLVGCDPTQSIGVYYPGDNYAKEELAESLIQPGENTYWTILQNVEQDDISYLLPFEKNLPTLEIGTAQWEVLLTVLQGKRDFDFIIMDMGNILDRETSSLMNRSDFMILLTETNRIANRKMQKLLQDSELLPPCECFLIANEYRSDGMRIAAESVFGTIAPYPTWEEVLEDPVFYQIALRVTEG